MSRLLRYERQFAHVRLFVRERLFVHERRMARLPAHVTPSFGKSVHSRLAVPLQRASLSEVKFMPSTTTAGIATLLA
jgi:hypothetical protein